MQLQRNWSGILCLYFFLLSVDSGLAQQAPINCKGPLSQAQLIGLLKGGVADIRVQAFVDKCDIDFADTPEVDKTLVAAGASKSVIAAVRRKDGERRRRAEERLWAEAKDGRSAERLEQYVKMFPEGQYASEAREKLTQLKRVEELRTKLRRAKTEGKWHEAEAWLKELTGLRAEDEEMRSWKSWVTAERARAQEARRREEEKGWDGAKDGLNAERLDEYLKRFPDGQHVAEAEDKQTRLKGAEDLRSKIRQAKERGQWQEAEGLLKELVELWPEDAEMRSWKTWVTGERAHWDSMTLSEARQEVALLEEKIAQIRRTVEGARDAELKQLESSYRSEREKAAQPDIFLTTAQHEQRIQGLEAKYKAERDTIEKRFAGQIEGQLEGARKRIEELKARTYVEAEAKIEFVNYKADDSRLIVNVNGEEYRFRVAPESARELVARLSAAKVYQYLGEDRAQRRVLVDTATSMRFNGILPADELKLITWTDPQTKLMWPLKDNGSDVNWNEATSYCQQLRLGDFTDWRSPDIAELEGIFNASSKQNYKVKTSIELTGNWAWSATREGADSAWCFYFYYGKRLSYPLIYGGYGRALCVRRSGE